MKNKFIAVEGNIGSGKTSLSTKLSKDFNSELIIDPKGIFIGDTPTLSIAFNLIILNIVIITNH